MSFKRSIFFYEYKHTKHPNEITYFRLPLEIKYETLCFENCLVVDLWIVLLFTIDHSYKLLFTR